MMTSLRRKRAVVLALSSSSLLAAALVACGATGGDGEDVAGGVGGKGSNVGGTAGQGRSDGGPGTGFEIDFPDETTGGGGQGDAGADQPGCGKLVAIVRDFQEAHIDFQNAEYNKGLLAGLVKPTLDEAKKPVYAHSQPTRITSQETFLQWYRDVDGVNMRFDVPLELEETSPGVYVFQSDAFFPLDGKGFGNEMRTHNFHFTTEIRGGFTYKGGEKFTFRGDDDVWVFVNGRLALDLGGVHGVAMATIDFDAKAGELGITRGQTYTFDVFHAERHTNASNFRMETSIECLTVPVL